MLFVHLVCIHGHGLVRYIPLRKFSISILEGAILNVSVRIKEDHYCASIEAASMIYAVHLPASRNCSIQELKELHSAKPMVGVGLEYLFPTALILLP